jgi:hypothetical protein
VTSPVEAPPSDPQITPARSRTPAALALFAAIAVGCGALAAVAWRMIVVLPSYVVRPDGSATVTERALTEFFAGDAWFVLLGAVVGLGLGVAAWRRFKGLGWPSAFVAAGLGLVAGLVCWQLGQLLGGASFDERLADAKPGQLVPISLQLRSPSGLALWAFAAVTPVLLGAALGPDEDAPPRAPRRPRRARTDEDEVIDERGVVQADEGNTQS